MGKQKWPTASLPTLGAPHSSPPRPPPPQSTFLASLPRPQHHTHHTALIITSYATTYNFLRSNLPRIHLSSPRYHSASRTPTKYHRNRINTVLSHATVTCSHGLNFPLLLIHHPPSPPLPQHRHHTLSTRFTITTTSDFSFTHAPVLYFYCIQHFSASPAHSTHTHTTRNPSLRPLTTLYFSTLRYLDFFVNLYYSLSQLLQLTPHFTNHFLPLHYNHKDHLVPCPFLPPPLAFLNITSHCSSLCSSRRNTLPSLCSSCWAEMLNLHSFALLRACLV